MIYNIEGEWTLPLENLQPVNDHISLNFTINKATLNWAVRGLFWKIPKQYERPLISNTDE